MIKNQNYDKCGYFDRNIGLIDGDSSKKHILYNSEVKDSLFLDYKRGKASANLKRVIDFAEIILCLFTTRNKV